MDQFKILEIKDHNLHSVKRLSDNIIFTVGDIINKHGHIKRLRYVGGLYQFTCQDVNGWKKLDTVNKIKTMRKFKLIKNYFDSGLKVGFEITFPDNKTIVEYYNGVYILHFNIKEVEKYPENWQEIIDKNYEILSFRNNEPEGFRMYTKLQRDGSYTCDGSVNGATEKWCFDEGYKIHSVKRLSDGEVFTIGDSTNRGIIEKINAIDRTICINQYVNSFKDLQHIKKPLFTTEDGVDIFNITDKYYMISNWSILPQTFDITTNNKHFSTKEATEEYILMNKPCLSVNDICKMVEKVRGNDSFNDSNFNKDLVKLVKKKLDYDN